MKSREEKNIICIIIIKLSPSETYFTPTSMKSHHLSEATLTTMVYGKKEHGGRLFGCKGRQWKAS
jgi:hypothetical protein